MTKRREKKVIHHSVI